jgi:hypothetical protein
LRLSQLLSFLDGQLLIAGTSSSVPPTQAQVAPQKGNDRPDLALLDTGRVSLKVRHITLLQSMKQPQQQQQQKQ